MNITTTTLLVALAGASYAVAKPLAVRQTPTDCSSITCTPASGAAQIFVSRGSTEDPGPGALGSISDAIVAACPSSRVTSNPYVALLDPYLSSEAQGVGNLTQLVTEYQACCPASQIVLLGYSQGAQVTADFLCGTSMVGFAVTPAYAASVAETVSAIVLMGDPSFVKGQSWNRGDAANVSFFPRQDNQACKPIAPQMISYCDSGDYFCDNGTSADALTIHEGYVEKYGTEAAKYVIGKIGC
ncbi:unnamed protein product [Discula destructiva]